MTSQDDFLDEQLVIVSNGVGVPNLKVSPADVDGPDPSQSLNLSGNDLFSMGNAGVSLDSPSPFWGGGWRPGTPDMSASLLGPHSFELTSDVNYPGKAASYTSSPSSSLPMTPLTQHMNDFSLEETSTKEMDNLILSSTHDDPNDEPIVFDGFARGRGLSRARSIHGSHMLQPTSVHSSSLDLGEGRMFDEFINPDAVDSGLAPDWSSSSVPPSSADDAANTSMSIDAFTSISSDNAPISTDSDALFTELGREITRAESITRSQQQRPPVQRLQIDQQQPLSPTQPSCGVSPYPSSSLVAGSHYRPPPSPSFAQSSISPAFLDAPPSDISSSATPGHGRRHSHAGTSPTSGSPRGRSHFRNYSASVSRKSSPYPRPEELSSPPESSSSCGDFLTVPDFGLGTGSTTLSRRRSASAAEGIPHHPAILDAKAGLGRSGTMPNRALSPYGRLCPASPTWDTSPASSRSASPLPPSNRSRDPSPMPPQGRGLSPASGSASWSSRNPSPMPSGSRNSSPRSPNYSGEPGKYYKDPQNGLLSEQIVKEQVGSDAIKSASKSRRTREAQFQCEICSSTFTARHNLTRVNANRCRSYEFAYGEDTVGMPEMWACIRDGRDQKPTRREM
ncbi:hypothetical protein FISHEDRAFT_56442 [Fistulina hepatica ATCC 64428]|uniref:C2H2-type domain-containing protein n=1 Tax=Fistulina hepatica ATCC 64428 TaxID=1128425 RepID=A0A0D7AIT6_9AGAR|nr:hypothetical protein FISHEDRAFT_56442 [Fistulina hepatica ATCC 64428]